MEKFWMVYVEGRQSPSSRHSTRAEAISEAERLARKEQQSVVLLEAVAFCSLLEPDPPVSWDYL
jgi:hypothetical protein